MIRVFRFSLEKKEIQYNNQLRDEYLLEFADDIAYFPKTIFITHCLFIWTYLRQTKYFETMQQFWANLSCLLITANKLAKKRENQLIIKR